MQRKKKWRGYFTFSRRERNVGIYLMVMIVFITIAPFLLGFVQPEPVSISKEIIANLDYHFVEVEEKKSTNDSPFQYAPKNYSNSNFVDDKKSQITTTELSLFYFNPNQISKQQWMQLGVAPYVADRLVNYVAKGGKYKTKNDLLKTYGFTQSDLERLNDYILLDSVITTIENKSVEKIVTINPILTNLNTANKEELMVLGFSADNATRIIKFREGAGGIYHADQLATVFGIDVAVLEAAKPYLLADANEITKININTATFEQLANHVYISDELAQAIVDYRNTTGKFYTLSEVRKVTGMYANLFEKLKPYLRI